MLSALIDPFRRCFDYRSRARRREYWKFVAWQLAIFAVVFLIGLNLPAIRDKGGWVIWVPFCHVALFGLPMLALQVRRLHDSDKSGWWVLTSLIPYLGLGIIIGLMAAPGTWGPNRFGPDPRHTWDDDLFE